MKDMSEKALHRMTKAELIVELIAARQQAGLRPKYDLTSVTPVYDSIADEDPRRRWENEVAS